MNLRVRSLGTVLLLGLFAVSCYAQEFSADVVYLPGTSASVSSSKATSFHPPSKLFVSKDNLRLETNGLTGTVLMVNAADQISVAMFPSRKMYEVLAGPPSEYFSVTNPEDACARWQQLSTQKINCKKVGAEMVNGRKAVKYQNEGAPESGVSVIWIDSALKYVIKWESARSGAELHNIREALQSADLFKVPRDYDPVRPQKPSKGFSKGKP